MTTRYSNEMVGVLDGALPAARADGGRVNAKRRSVVATIDLAAQASGDIIVLGKRPIGSVWLGGAMITDTSLGAATAAIGIVGNTGKYRAAAVFTTTETPTGFSKAAAEKAAALTVEETIILTIAAAAFPGAGILVVRYDYLVTA